MSSFAADSCFKTLAFVSASFLLLSLLRSGNIAVSFMRYFFITPDGKGGELFSPNSGENLKERNIPSLSLFL